MDKLRSLASSKIHCVNSTAKGEITYARYVYQYTRKEDTAVRAPIANFWATRSHTLRAEAEEEFRSLCLEFPQFGYDVLSKSLSLYPTLVPNPGSRCWRTATNVLLQPASWTRSSSGNATKSYTQRPAARASVPDTARSRPAVLFLSYCTFITISAIPSLYLVGCKAGGRMHNAPSPVPSSLYKYSMTIWARGKKTKEEKELHTRTLPLLSPIFND